MELERAAEGHRGLYEQIVLDVRRGIHLSTYSNRTFEKVLQDKHGQASLTKLSDGDG